MNKKIVAGLGALTLIAGIAIPTVTRASDASEKHELRQAKTAVNYTLKELHEALDEAKEHGDDLNHCNNIRLAISAAEQTRDQIQADIEEDEK